MEFLTDDAGSVEMMVGCLLIEGGMLRGMVYPSIIPDTLVTLDSKTLTHPQFSLPYCS